MIKNPIKNGVLASAYIFFVVTVLSSAEKMSDQPDSLLTPVAFISLFTLSVAMMGYLFFLQPLQMYLDGKKKEAIDFFVKTLATFGLITAVLLIMVFTGIVG